MNKRGRHIQAFTIFEVAVTMVITAIILMMVYQIFGVARQQLSVYIRMQDDVITYEQFTTQFSIDVQRTSEIKKIDSRSIQLLVDNDKVTYAFAKAYVLRETKVIDTLPVIIKSIQLDTVIGKHDMHLAIRLQGRLLGNPIEIYEAKKLDVSARINKRFL